MFFLISLMIALFIIFGDKTDQSLIRGFIISTGIFSVVAIYIWMFVHCVYNKSHDYKLKTTGHPHKKQLNSIT